MNENDNSLYEFLKDSQILFAIWGVFGILLFYLLSIVNSSQNALNDIISNSANNQTLVPPIFQTITIQVTLLPFALVADFFLFIVVSIVIAKSLLKWTSDLTNDTTADIYDVCIGLAFFIFFIIFVLFLALDITLSFLTITTNYVLAIIAFFEITVIVFVFYSRKNILAYKKEKDEQEKKASNERLNQSP